MDNQGTHGPLHGIRVLDWTMWQFGPVSTSMLGDMGADVIKIEALDGDAARNMTRVGANQTNLPGGRNAYFETNNRNKRSIAVDLRTPEGRGIIHGLAKKADVFVQNFRKGVAERNDLGYDTLCKINPMLVYGSASGFGPEGPDAYQPSFDMCGQARAGLMASATPPGAEEPNWVRGGVSDQIGAIMLAFGVLGGLVCRSQQGMGQKVDVSHLSSVMWLQGLAIGMGLLGGSLQTQYSDRRHVVNPLVNLYQCKGGRWLQIMMIQPDRYWKDFATVLGIPELIEDPRFAGMQQRMQNAPELVEILDRQFATKTFDEWDKAFREGGDFIYARVQSLEELQGDPQVVANSYITGFNHPALGPVRVCSHPIIYSTTPAGVWREAPELGEHTEEILIEDLGYDWARIEKLREANAIR